MLIREKPNYSQIMFYKVIFKYMTNDKDTYLKYINELGFTFNTKFIKNNIHKPNLTQLAKLCFDYFTVVLISKYVYSPRTTIQSMSSIFPCFKSIGWCGMPVTSVFLKPRTLPKVSGLYENS